MGKGSDPPLPVGCRGHRHSDHSSDKSMFLQQPVFVNDFISEYTLSHLFSLFTFFSHPQLMLLPPNREKLNNVKKLISEFPQLNQINLAYLILFLHDISTYELKNKMNAKALGICIGSNLLRLPKVRGRKALSLHKGHRGNSDSYSDYRIFSN